jgi:hypothetical protein
MNSILFLPLPSDVIVTMPFNSSFISSLSSTDAVRPSYSSFSFFSSSSVLSAPFASSGVPEARDDAYDLVRWSSATSSPSSMCALSSAFLRS